MRTQTKARAGPVCPYSTSDQNTIRYPGYIVVIIYVMRGYICWSQRPSFNRTYTRIHHKKRVSSSTPSSLSSVLELLKSSTNTRNPPNVVIVSVDLFLYFSYIGVTLVQIKAFEAQILVFFLLSRGKRIYRAKNLSTTYTFFCRC